MGVSTAATKATGPPKEVVPAHPARILIAELTDYDAKMNSPTPSPAKEFTLAPALSGETLASANFPLCQALLRNERRYPWVIMVPTRPHMTEIFDLLPADQAAMWAEISAASAALKAATGATKINIAAFGNMTPQLHVHLVARTEGDAHWPASAVGVDGAQPYDAGIIPAWWAGFLDQLPLLPAAL